MKMHYRRMKSAGKEHICTAKRHYMDAMTLYRIGICAQQGENGKMEKQQNAKTFKEVTK